MKRKLSAMLSIAMGVMTVYAAEPMAYGNESQTIADSIPSAGDISVTGICSDSVYPPNEGTVGLVLSGGGAKGIAHVGVIKALEENDIPIDYVTGTSMGAIVGSLYACGWSPEKMLALFTSKDFEYWSTGTIPKDRKYYYIQPYPTPKWLDIGVNFHSSGKVMNQILPTSLISPLPMNIEFLNLYGPYTEQCGENFNNLMVPFRCVASDVYNKHKIVLSDGSLGDAVRASMSFPTVFRPIKLNGVLVYDGGIYDNFPVDVMTEDFHPDFMIGVAVSGADKKPMKGDLYSQLEDMIIQNNDYSLPAEKGVKIQVPVRNYAVLDFGKAKEIYEIGYKTGLAMVDSIKRRIKMRRPLSQVRERREVFAANTPVLKFDSIEITGATPDQERYLKFLFFGGRPRTISMPDVESAYYRAVTDGSLNNLLPQAEFNRDGRNTLLLEASVRKPWSLGVGGWITSSTNSFLFVQAGYHSLSFNSLAVNLSGWVGQSYYAGMLSAQFTFPSRNPSLVQMEAVVSRQKYYDSEVLFYETSAPVFITGDVSYLRGSYVWAIGTKVKGSASLAWGYMGDHYFPGNDGSYADKDRDKMQYRMGVAKVLFEKNTLNDAMYPSGGLQWKGELTGCYEQSRYLPEGQIAGNGAFKDEWWAGLEFLWKQYFSVERKVAIGAFVNTLGTFKKPNQNYIASLVHSTEFAPTPSTRNYFNEAFRSDNYVAAGVMTVWKPMKLLQIRGDFFVYSKIRELENRGQEITAYGDWFKRVDFIGEVAAVINFPFASLSLYVNYLSYPSHNWNFGINFGLYFQAPKLK